jgi:hypothetical protein
MRRFLRWTAALAALMLPADRGGGPADTRE